MLKTIVIPVYRGARTIGSLVDKLIATLGANQLQIVLVNDGSPDNSHQVCSDLANQHSKVITYVCLSKNFGEHNAVMAGLNYAQGDYVVIMDDDFQNPPEEVNKIIDYAYQNKLDVVYTYSKKKEHNVFRNFGSQFNNLVASCLLDKPKDLYLSSFKCINKFVVGEIIKYKGPYPYIDGLILRFTRNLGQIEVVHNKREEGQSGYTLRKLLNLWLNMFVNFSVYPLRISSLVGVICSGVGLVLAATTVLEKLENPNLPVGWASLTIMIIFFSGVQLLILGIVGEYLGRLYLSSNQTPQYVVREIKSKEK